MAALKSISALGTAELSFHKGQGFPSTWIIVFNACSAAKEERGSWLPHLRDITLKQGCQTHFHRGPRQPCGCFKEPNVILGWYKCNYSLSRGNELSTFAGEKQGAGPVKQGGGPGLVFATCALKGFLCYQHAIIYSPADLQAGWSGWGKAALPLSGDSRELPGTAVFMRLCLGACCRSESLYNSPSKLETQRCRRLARLVVKLKKFNHCVKQG